MSRHPKYPKLVRDKIPDIIQKAGKVPLIDIAHDRQVPRLIARKLIEESCEYLRSLSEEELVDIGEILDTALRERKISQARFERMKARKRAAKGGFSHMIVLFGIRSPRKKAAAR